VKNVVIDARHATKTIDGLGRYIIELINGLSGLPTLPKIIILHTNDFPFDGISNINAFTFHLVNIKGGSPKQHMVLPFVIRKLKANVYFYPFIDPPFFSPARINIYAVHDLNHFFFSPYAATTSHLAIIMAKFFIYTSSIRYKKIVVFSEFVKQQLNNQIPFSRSKTITIYHGYTAFDNILMNDPLIDQSLMKEKFILYIGNNRPHKNLERLFKAFELLNQKLPEVKLIVAGNQIPRFFNIDEYITNSPAKDSFIRINKPSNSYLAFLYKHAELVAYPSLSEGFGFPLLEAWAFKAAIVTSNATCIPEIAGDAAEYFNPFDIVDISKSIQKVIENEDLKKQLITQGSVRLQNYNWSTSAAAHLQLFMDIHQN